MEKAGFIDRLGRENVCPHIDAALNRAREILGLPPAKHEDPLQVEREQLKEARNELVSALERTNNLLNGKKDSTKPTSNASHEVML